MSINDEHMSVKKCSWCKDDKALAEPMCTGILVPFICSKCGTNVGSLDYKGLRKLISYLREDNNQLRQALKEIKTTLG